MNMGPIETARAHWPTPLPDWIEVLAVESGRTSQAAVAKRIGRSAAVISQILRRAYPADMARIEERVRGVFLDAKVLCPALGDLPAQTCQDWRAKAASFAIGNPLRTRMYRACNTCPRHLQPGKEEAE